jgi:hypothetical protein
VGPRAGLDIVETRSLGIPKHRREDNIKIEHIRIGWNGVTWTELFQDRFIGEYDNELSCSIIDLLDIIHRPVFY